MKKIITIALLAIATNASATFSATKSGNVLSLTYSGVTKAKAAAQKAASAYAYSLVITGNGYTALPNLTFTVQVTNSLAGLHRDYAVVQAGSVGADPEPTYSGSGGTDHFGNPSGSDGSSYHQSTSYNYHGNENSCATTGTVSISGTCAGGVASCTHFTAPLGSSVGPWYHPKCSCDGACAQDSPGCPYTSASPCTPFGDGIDAFAEVEQCYCADLKVNAETTAWPGLLPPYNPAGNFQPEDIPSIANTNSNAAAAEIADALEWIEANIPEGTYTNPATAMGQTYAIISDGSIALNTPVILEQGDYTYPVGSPAAGGGSCSTCAAVSPSTSPTSNVWVENQQLHVWIDNPPDFPDTIALDGSVTIADGTAVTGAAASTIGYTTTLTAVYDQWVIDRDTIPLQSLITNLALPAVSSTTLQTEWCFDSPKFGNHCLDMNDWGLPTILAIFRFLVIGGAYVTAFYMVWG